MNEFDRLVGPLDPVKFAQTKQARAEHQLVRFLLQTFDLKRYETSVYAHSADVGSELLCLRGFGLMFPAFPVHLVYFQPRVPLHLDPKSTVPAMFRNFFRTPVGEAWLTMWHDLQPSEGAPLLGRPFGMAAPRRGFQRGILVYSGGPEPLCPDQFSFRAARGGACAYVLPLSDVMRKLASGVSGSRMSGRA